MSEPRLLIVEDNEEVGQMLILFFGSRSFKVSLAPDGAAALAQARDFLPNLILLDVGLPDIDGYELFKKFRESARTRHIPVIFLTRRGRKADRLAGLQLGADDFITKPFDLEELFLRVQNAITRAQRESLSHPHTGLPAGPMAKEAIAAAKTRPDRAELVRKAIVDKFNGDVIQHYTLGERSGDQVKVKDSAGRERMLPLMKLEAALAK